MTTGHGAVRETAPGHVLVMPRHGVDPVLGVGQRVPRDGRTFVQQLDVLLDLAHLNPRPGVPPWHRVAVGAVVDIRVPGHFPADFGHVGIRAPRAHRLQMGPLLIPGFIDLPIGGAMHPAIGHLGSPRGS